MGAGEFLPPSVWAVCVSENFQLDFDCLGVAFEYLFGKFSFPRKVVVDVSFAFFQQFVGAGLGVLQTFIGFVEL